MYPTACNSGKYQWIPARVSAAQEFLRFCEGIRSPMAMGFSLPGDSPSSNGRDLTKLESAAYDAALNTLLGYFTGEMDYGDSGPSAAHDDESDGTSLIPQT